MPFILCLSHRWSDVCVRMRFFPPAQSVLISHGNTISFEAGWRDKFFFEHNTRTTPSFGNRHSQHKFVIRMADRHWSSHSSLFSFIGVWREEEKKVALCKRNVIYHSISHYTTWICDMWYWRMRITPPTNFLDVHMQPKKKKSAPNNSARYF